MKVMSMEERGNFEFEIERIVIEDFHMLLPQQAKIGKLVALRGLKHIKAEVSASS